MTALFCYNSKLNYIGEKRNLIVMLSRLKAIKEIKLKNMKIIKKLSPIMESISNVGKEKKELKEELREGEPVGVLPNADAVALKQHIEDRATGLERRANPDKDPLVKELIDETASEKSRTLHYDVVDRKELAKVLTEAKKNNQKFKVGKSNKEGFRYFVDILPIYGSKGALEADDGEALTESTSLKEAARDVRKSPAYIKAEKDASKVLYGDRNAYGTIFGYIADDHFYGVTPKAMSQEEFKKYSKDLTKNNPDCDICAVYQSNLDASYDDADKEETKKFNQQGGAAWNDADARNKKGLNEEMITESYKSDTLLDDILNWFADHKQAKEDLIIYLKNNNYTDEDIKDLFEIEDDVDEESEDRDLDEDYDIDDLNNDEVYDNFYGLRGLHVYFPNGMGSDPHVYYKDLEMNYYDLADSMWEDFKEDLGDKLKGLNANELDIEFEKWLKENESYVQNFFLEATTKDSDELNEDLQLYASSLKDFKPAKEAEELWNEIIEKGKLDDLEYQLENVFKADEDKNASIDIEGLNDLLVNHPDFIRTLIDLDGAPLEDDDYDEEPVGDNEMVYYDDEEEPVDKDTPIDKDDDVDYKEIDGTDDSEKDDDEEPIDYNDESTYDDEEIPPFEDDEDEYQEYVDKYDPEDKPSRKIRKRELEEESLDESIEDDYGDVYGRRGPRNQKDIYKDRLNKVKGNKPLTAKEYAELKGAVKEDLKKEPELKLDNEECDLDEVCNKDLKECDISKDDELTENIANSFIKNKFTESKDTSKMTDEEKKQELTKQTLNESDEEEVIDVDDKELTEALGMPTEDQVKKEEPKDEVKEEVKPTEKTEEIKEECNDEKVK